MSAPLGSPSCGHPVDQQEHNNGAARPYLADGEQPPGLAGQKNGVTHVTAAGPIASVFTPSTQSFEELEIPAAFRSTVEKELSADEKILWLGRPSRNRQVHPRKTVFLAASLGLMGIGVVIVGAGLLSRGGPDVFPMVFGGALGLIGFVFMLPWLIDPTKSCRYCYVVTNRRAMIVEPNLWARGGPSAKSYLPHQLLGIERQDNAEVPGAGDLIFEYIFALPGKTVDLATGAFLPQGGGFGRSDTPKRIPRGFFLLDQVREVENLIRTNLLAQLEETPAAPKSSPAANPAAPPRAEAVPSASGCGAAVGAPATPAGRFPVSIPSPGVSDGAGADSGRYREDGQIPEEVKAKALVGLDPNETVVWIGQPTGTLVFVRSIAYLAGGGVVALIALIWLISALTPSKGVDKGTAARQSGKQAAAPQKQESSNPLIPVGLLAVSAGIAAVPFVRRYSAGRSCYVLTNRRAIVYKHGLFGPTRETYTPLEVAGMQRGDSWLFKGSGDLIFRTVHVIKSARSNGLLQQNVKTIHYGFLAIPHLNEVEKLVRETLIDRFVDKLNRASSL